MTALRGSTTSPLPSFTVTAAELRTLALVALASGSSIEPPLAAGLVDDLVGRELLVRTGETVALPTGALGGAIEIVAQSHVQLQVRHVAPSLPGVPGSTWFALTPVVGVELRQEDELWHVEAFATRDVLARVSRATGLVERTPAGVETFFVTGTALERCADRLALGDRSGAQDALSMPGAPIPIAVRSFVSAISARETVSAVVRSQPPRAGDPSEHRDTRTFGWMDSVDWGLWKVPVPEPSSDKPTAVGPLTALAICAGLAQLFPVTDDPEWQTIRVPFAATSPAAS